MTLSHDLSWRTHINKISQKASQKLGFIKRNLKGCTRVFKRLAYIAFVQSGLEYASSIWDPHLTKDRDTLEHIQRRAGCWIANAHGPNVSVTELLRDLSLEPCDVRCRVSRLTSLYKVLNEHVVPPDKIDLVLCRRPVHTASLYKAEICHPPLAVNPIPGIICSQDNISLELSTRHCNISWLGILI